MPGTYSRPYQSRRPSSHQSAANKCATSSFNLYLLDSNLVSEAWKPRPNPGVMRFLKATPLNHTYLSLFTVTELCYGINLLAEGKRRRELEHVYTTTLQAYANRIITPDMQISKVYATLAADQKRAGTPRPIFDLWLAATAQVTGFTIATRNIADFASLNLWTENPFDARG